jgi:hypothetical protein
MYFSYLKYVLHIGFHEYAYLKSEICQLTALWYYHIYPIITNFEN